MSIDNENSISRMLDENFFNQKENLLVDHIHFQSLMETYIELVGRYKVSH
jgi:hypothetical protein